MRKAEWCQVNYFKAKGAIKNIDKYRSEYTNEHGDEWKLKIFPW
jgi:hypothetical protein